MAGNRKAKQSPSDQAGPESPSPQTLALKKRPANECLDLTVPALHTAWKAHADIDLTLDEICYNMSISLQHLHEQALVDGMIRLSMMAHQNSRAYAIVDHTLLQLKQSVDRTNPDTLDGDKASKISARIVRTVAMLTPVLTTLATAPAAIQANSASGPPEPEGYTPTRVGVPARYNDEEGRPIDLDHPAIIEAAMDAAFDCRLKLETQARARQSELLYQQQLEQRQNLAHPSSGYNYEVYCEEPAPPSVADLPPQGDCTISHDPVSTFSR
jgi:hypothetical protein